MRKKSLQDAQKLASNKNGKCFNLSLTVTGEFLKKLIEEYFTEA